MKKTDNMFLKKIGIVIISLIFVLTTLGQNASAYEIKFQEETGPMGGLEESIYEEAISEPETDISLEESETEAELVVENETEAEPANEQAAEAEPAGPANEQTAEAEPAEPANEQAAEDEAEEEPAEPANEQAAEDEAKEEPAEPANEQAAEDEAEAEPAELVTETETESEFSRPAVETATENEPETIIEEKVLVTEPETEEKQEQERNTDVFEEALLEEKIQDSNEKKDLDADKAENKITYLDAPVIATVSYTKAGIKFTWSATENTDVYRVYRRQSGEGKWTALGNTFDLYYTDSTAVSGIFYEYTVKSACRGNGKTLFSDYAGIKKAYYLSAVQDVATIISGNSIKITWQEKDGATGYGVFRADYGSNQYTKLKDVTSTSYTDATVHSGQKYYYLIKPYAKVSGTKYLGYAEKPGTLIRFMAAPEITSVSSASNGIKISWSKVSNAQKYRVYRRVKGKTKWTVLYTRTINGTSADLTYTDTAAEEKIHYEYSVRSVYTKDAKSTFSDYAEAKSYIFVPAPKNVSATNVLNGITIKWNADSEVTGYRIYRQANGTGEWVKLKTLSSSYSSYTDKTVKPGNQYVYRMRAYIKKDEKTCWSAYNAQYATKVRLEHPVLSKVEIVEKGYKVSWKQVSGADKYNIYRKQKGTSAWKYLGYSATTSFIDITADQSLRYYYTVSACTGPETCYYDTNGILSPAASIEALGIIMGLEYNISAVFGNFVIGIKSGSFVPGTEIQLETVNKDLASQKFIIQDAGNGYYYIRNTKTWNVLDIGSNSVVCQKEFTGSNTQKWKIIPTNDSEDSCYFINNNGKYLSTKENGSLGSTLIVKADDGSDSLKFLFANTKHDQGIDFSKNGTQYLGFREYLIKDGNLAQNTGYYDITTNIVIAGGDYSIDTNNIGLKVISVNNYLVDHGYLSADYYSYERFDWKTDSAVRIFQKEKGLKVTGTVDLETWMAMGLSKKSFTELGTFVTGCKVDRYLGTRESYINVMLETAKSYVGSDYRVGSSGKPGTYLDCSGLIFQCLYAAGICPDYNIVDHALEIYEYTSRNMAVDPKLGINVTMSNIQPGDLVFYSNYSGIVNHVAIYAGNGMIYDSYPGFGVTKRGIYDAGPIHSIKRVF